MPNWKKVIVSGSDAVLNSVTTTGDIIVGGSIFAQNYIISSSVTHITTSFSSGSTVFGDTLDDNHQFTGSVNITGSFINLGLSYPTTDGTAGQFITTDGAGNLTFSSTTTHITASSISASYIDLDPIQDGDEPAWKEGRIFYSAENGALSVYNSEADITLQVGQEFWKKAKNGLSVSIPNGTPVRVSGALGGNPLVYPAISENHIGNYSYENHIVGVATHNIGGNSIGFITEKGNVNNLDTSMFGEGDTLFLQTSSAGFRNTPPPFPYDIVQVGTVIRSHASVGSIEVNSSEPTHFGNISGLSGSVSGPGDLWVYQSNGAWTPSKTLSGSYTINGTLTTTGDLTTEGDLIIKSPTTDSSISSIAISIPNDSTYSLDGVTATEGIIYEYTLFSAGISTRTGILLIACDGTNLEYTDVTTVDTGNDPNPPIMAAALNSGVISLKITGGQGYKFKALRKIL